MRASYTPLNLLFSLLNQAAQVCSLEFQQDYKDRCGMLRAKWRVLFHLGLHGRMTASAISQSAKIHKTKISRGAAPLRPAFPVADPGRGRPAGRTSGADGAGAGCL